MPKPLDPVQRHIVAVLKLDSIVPDDTGQIIAPSFDMLRYPIAGRAFPFDAMGRGRYERQ